MTSADLDHVAIATTDIAAALELTVGDLGGIVVHGGDGYGFRWVQARLGTATTGMTVELLVAWNPEVDDFLARFIARHGAGVHHITFKVDDLEATLDRANSIGLHPVGVSLENPQWREAFLQPREAHGTVVQLAQTEYGADDFAQLVEHAAATVEVEGTPIWWPSPPTRAATPTVLRRVVIGTPDRARASEFFADFLGGAPTADSEWTDLAWPGGGQIRLVDAPTAGVVRLEGDGPTTRRVDLSGARLEVAKHRRASITSAE
jgi:methylmalonyl-CoA/ethylmalonyl-CoA epimerase